MIHFRLANRPRFSCVKKSTISITGSLLLKSSETSLIRSEMVPSLLINNTPYAFLNLE